MSVVPGYDYVPYGTSWPNPSHITYSIASDGVFWDHGTNNLNATFNAKFGTNGIWERQIALALATWESVANINIVPVADGPYELNTLGMAQGDPRFGDIRVRWICVSRHHHHSGTDLFSAPARLDGRGRRRDQHIHELQYRLDL